MKKLIFFICMTWSIQAFAQDYEDRAAATFFLEADGSYLTNKSEMVESNDTGFGYSYKVGFHAGSKREIGVIFKSEFQNTNFALNSSQIQTSWQDAIIRYRLGTFYLGMVMTSITLKANLDGTELVDAIGTGYGGNAGFYYSMGKLGGGYVDLTYSTISAIRDIEQRDVSVGARMDADIGVSFRVTKRLFDIISGVKYRTTAITLEDSYNEVVSAVYLGFRLMATF